MMAWLFLFGGGRRVAGEVKNSSQTKKSKKLHTDGWDLLGGGLRK